MRAFSSRSSRRSSLPGQSSTEPSASDRSISVSSTSDPSASGKRSGPTLKARAIRHLARREHSRAELRGKLASQTDDAQALDALLDELEAKSLLSDRRYSEVVVRASASRHGAARIARKLADAGVDGQISAPLLSRLKAHEPQLAFDLWSRRFGSLPGTQQEKARQFRFLLARGFGPQVVHGVWRQASQRVDGETQDDRVERLSIGDLLGEDEP